MANSATSHVDPSGLLKAFIRIVGNTPQPNGIVENPELFYVQYSATLLGGMLGSGNKEPLIGGYRLEGDPIRTNLRNDWGFTWHFSVGDPENKNGHLVFSLPKFWEGWGSDYKGINEEATLDGNLDNDNASSFYVPRGTKLEDALADSTLQSQFPQAQNCVQVVYADRHIAFTTISDAFAQWQGNTIGSWVDNILTGPFGGIGTVVGPPAAPIMPGSAIGGGFDNSTAVSMRMRMAFAADGQQHVGVYDYPNSAKYQGITNSGGGGIPNGQIRVHLRGLAVEIYTSLGHQLPQVRGEARFERFS